MSLSYLDLGNFLPQFPWLSAALVLSQLFLYYEFPELLLLTSKVLGVYSKGYLIYLSVYRCSPSFDLVSQLQYSCWAWSSLLVIDSCHWPFPLCFLQIIAFFVYNISFFPKPFLFFFLCWLCHLCLVFSSGSLIYFLVFFISSFAPLFESLLIFTRKPWTSSPGICICFSIFGLSCWRVTIFWMNCVALLFCVLGLWFVYPLGVDI